MIGTRLWCWASDIQQKCHARHICNLKIFSIDIIIIKNKQLKLNWTYFIQPNVPQVVSLQHVISIKLSVGYLIICFFTIWNLLYISQHISSWATFHVLRSGQWLVTLILDSAALGHSELFLSHELLWHQSPWASTQNVFTQNKTKYVGFQRKPVILKCNY